VEPDAFVNVGRFSMSWSKSTGKVSKADAEEAIKSLTLGDEATGPSVEQFDAAKRAACELLKTVPGPFVSASFSGHANGVGWQKREGYSNDSINVVVTQLMESD
jgi:hypothetical protein